MKLSQTPNRVLDRDLAMQLEIAERDMWRANWLSAPAGSALELGMHGEESGGAFALICEGLPDWFFNRVIGLGMEQAATQDVLHDLIALYRNKRLPLGVSLCPFAEPSGISSQLVELGFHNALNWAKMFRGTELLPNTDTDLQIQSVQAEHYDQAAEVICRGFDMPAAMQPVFGAALRIPENYAYMAWDRDQPAAIGILSVRNGVGHLNTACTLPEYRRRGAQGALMAYRIRQGIEMGCRLFATETGIVEGQNNSSLQNMERLGFRQAYVRANYVLS